MDGFDPLVGDPALDSLIAPPPEPPLPPVDEPPPPLPAGHTRFEPLDYFKLKATLLEIAVQEAQLREQAMVLQAQKLKLLASMNLPPAAYRFNDESFTVESM